MKQIEGVNANGRYHSKGWFDVRFIESVVKEIEEGLPVRAALLKYNLKNSVVYRWIERYGSGSRPLKRKDLPVKDKRTIVRAVAGGQLSVASAAKAYQVSRDSVQRWLRQNVAENEELSFSNQQPLTKKKAKNKEQSRDVDIELEQLQQHLADAQLKIAALNTLIDIAEEQLKINIRKKPGARQS